MDLKDRVQARLEALDLSPRAASIEAGLNTHFLQQVLSGKTRSPRGENLNKLAAVLQTTPEWLLDGRGDPDAPTDRESAEIVGLMPILSAMDREKVVDYARFLRQRAEQEKKKG